MTLVATTALTPPTIIRPSSLTSWADCPRRAAAVMLRREIEADLGIVLCKASSGVAAMIGTALHAGAAAMLQDKLTGRWGAGSRTAGEQAALATFADQTLSGVVWDATSPNRNVGERQLVRMAAVYARDLAPRIEPEAVEERREVDAGDGFVVSGQSDVVGYVARERRKVRDLKSGVVSRTHAAQIGAYAIIEHSHGQPVVGAVVDFIPRVRITAEQPPAATSEYPLEDIVQVALHRIDRIKREVSEYRRRVEAGDEAPEWAFDSNPMSMLCTERFCPAWGTTWCNEWKWKDRR